MSVFELSERDGHAVVQLSALLAADSMKHARSVVPA